MYYLITMSSDSCEVAGFRKSESLDELRDHLAEWAAHATESDADELKGMSISTLADEFDVFGWGENDTKLVHIIKELEEGNLEKIL